MSTQKRSEAQVQIENVGGIEEESFVLTEGTNLLSGPNSTNKTSALRAVSGALGAENVRLKSDAEEGSVKLEIGGEVYSRTLTKGKSGNTRLSGEPYLEEGSKEARAAELFAFLLESNEARLAVETEGDLREAVMDPVDTDEIQDEISGLINKRERIEDEIEETEGVKQKLEELQSKRRGLLEEKKDKEAELEGAKEEAADAEKGVEDIKERRSDLDDLIEEKNHIEDEIDSLEERISSEEKSIESLRDSIEQKTEELEEHGSVDEKKAEVSEIEDEIERLEARKNEISKILSELQEVVEFNSRMLKEGEGGVQEVLGQSGDKKEVGVTQEDVFGDEAVCWTCGTEVEKEKISETVEGLRDLREKKNKETNEIQNEIAGLRERKESLREEISRKESLEDRIKSERDEIEERERSLDDLREEVSSKRDELEEVENDISEAESELEGVDSGVLEAHRRKKQLEVEVRNLKRDVEDLEDEIDKTERRLDELPDLKNELEKTEEDLSEARNRIESIEDEAVESFNHHMDEILEVLGYERVERVWIEKREVSRREGRKKVKRNVFDLNVVREDEDGNVYEDEVDSLSESEKEVTGLVFALAGYLAHEVYEDLPFMIVDSVEALDADRVEELLGYFGEYAPYLLVAVLPETFEKVEDGYNEIQTA